MRTWKIIDGEPYMINPRLGVLALQALNPKRRTMAKHYGARHMAWVRSFRKKNRSHRRKHRRNPYPMAGTVAALNPRRHRRKHNPFTFSRSTLGLPAIQPVLFGAGGFIGTAAVQGFIDTLVPVGWKTNPDGTPNLMTKYGEILVSIVLTSWAGKMVLGSRGDTTMIAVGGGIYALQQAAHDFIPGMIPGMHSYTPLKSYTPLRPSSTMGRSVESAGGQFPQLATRASMRQLAAPVQGFRNSANFADDGGMNVVAERFRRF
jgi:hypothetical protein